MKHFLNKRKFNIFGAGGGGGQAAPPPIVTQYPGVLAPPQLGSMSTINSFSYAEMIDLLSDGPIEGLVNKFGQKVYDENLKEGIYYNQIAIKETSNDSSINIPINFIKEKLKKIWYPNNASIFIDANTNLVSKITSAEIGDVNFDGADITITSYHPDNSIQAYANAIGADYASLKLVKKAFDLTPIKTEYPFLTVINIPSFKAQIPLDRFDITEGGDNKQYPIKLSIPNLSNYIYFSIGVDDLTSFNYLDLPRSYIFNNISTVSNAKTVFKVIKNTNTLNFATFEFSQINIFIWSIYNKQTGIKNISDILDRYLNDITIYQNHSSLFNYPMTQIEIRNGSELQSPLNSIDSIAIDTSYQQPLNGPFKITNNFTPKTALDAGGVQRLLSYNQGEIGIANISLEDETSDDIRAIKAWPVEYDKNQNPYMICNAKPNYAAFDKQSRARVDQEASPITHYISNQNVDCVNVTLAIDSLFDINHVDLVDRSAQAICSNKYCQTDAPPLGFPKYSELPGLGYNAQSSTNNQVNVAYFLLLSSQSSSWIVDGGYNIDQAICSLVNIVNPSSSLYALAKKCFASIPNFSSYITAVGSSNYKYSADETNKLYCYLILNQADNQIKNSICWNYKSLTDLNTCLKTLDSLGNLYYRFGLSQLSSLVSQGCSAPNYLSFCNVTNSFIDSINLNSSLYKFCLVQYKYTSTNTQLTTQYSIATQINNLIDVSTIWNGFTYTANGSVCNYNDTYALPSSSISLINDNQHNYNNLICLKKHVIDCVQSIIPKTTTVTKLTYKNSIPKILLLGVDLDYLKSINDYWTDANKNYLTINALENLLRNYSLTVGNSLFTDFSSNENVKRTDFDLVTSFTNAFNCKLDPRILSCNCILDITLVSSYDAKYSKCPSISTLIKDNLYRSDIIYLKDSNYITPYDNDYIIKYSVYDSTVQSAKLICAPFKSDFYLLDSQKNTSSLNTKIPDVVQTLTAGTKMPTVVSIKVETGYESDDDNNFFEDGYCARQYDIYGMATAPALIDLGDRQYSNIQATNVAPPRGCLSNTTYNTYLNTNFFLFKITYKCTNPAGQTSCSYKYYVSCDRGVLYNYIYSDKLNLNKKLSIPILQINQNNDCSIKFNNFEDIYSYVDQSTCVKTVEIITNSCCCRIGQRSKYYICSTDNYNYQFNKTEIANLQQSFNDIFSYGFFNSVGPSIIPSICECIIDRIFDKNTCNNYTNLNLIQLYSNPESEVLKKFAGNYYPFTPYSESISPDNSNINCYDTYEFYSPSCSATSFDTSCDAIKIETFNFIYQLYSPNSTLDTPIVLNCSYANLFNYFCTNTVSNPNIQFIYLTAYCLTNVKSIYVDGNWIDCCTSDNKLNFCYNGQVCSLLDAIQSMCCLNNNNWWQCATLFTDNSYVFEASVYCPSLSKDTLLRNQSSCWNSLFGAGWYPTAEPIFKNITCQEYECYNNSESKCSYLNFSKQLYDNLTATNRDSQFCILSKLTAGIPLVSETICQINCACLFEPKKIKYIQCCEDQIIYSELFASQTFKIPIVSQSCFSCTLTSQFVKPMSINMKFWIANNPETSKVDVYFACYANANSAKNDNYALMSSSAMNYFNLNCFYSGFCNTQPCLYGLNSNMLGLNTERNLLDWLKSSRPSIIWKCAFLCAFSDTYILNLSNDKGSCRLEIQASTLEDFSATYYRNDLVCKIVEAAVGSSCGIRYYCSLANLGTRPITSSTSSFLNSSINMCKISIDKSNFGDLSSISIASVVQNCFKSLGYIPMESSIRNPNTTLKKQDFKTPQGIFSVYFANYIVSNQNTETLLQKAPPNKIVLPPPRYKKDGSTLKRYVKITKLSHETLSPMISKKIGLQKITEIIPQTFSYPFSAIISNKIDSRSFAQIPERTYDCKLKKVLVPSNYFPNDNNGNDLRYLKGGGVNKIYSGDWDGTFKLAWTNNPAWILMDMLINKRYGLGSYIESNQVDIWELYKIARWCDGVDAEGYYYGVPDSYGGVEPRHAFNAFLSEKFNVFDMINQIASVFRGHVYYMNSLITFDDDRLKPIIGEFNNNDVKDGLFNYTNLKKDDEYTALDIRYLDAKDNFNPKIEYVEDSDGIRNKGLLKKEFNVFGITSRGQARRFGKHFLFHTSKENNTVQFTTDIKALLYKPGDLIAIHDELLSSIKNFGTIKDVVDLDSTKFQIVIDKCLDPTIYDINEISLYTPIAKPKYEDICAKLTSKPSNIIMLRSGINQFQTFISGMRVTSQQDDSQCAIFTPSSETDANGNYEFFSTYTGLFLNTCYNYIQPVISLKLSYIPDVNMYGSPSKYGHWQLNNLTNSACYGGNNFSCYCFKFDAINNPENKFNVVNKKYFFEYFDSGLAICNTTNMYMTATGFDLNNQPLYGNVPQTSSSGFGSSLLNAFRFSTKNYEKPSIAYYDVIENDRPSVETFYLDSGSGNSGICYGKNGDEDYTIMTLSKSGSFNLKSQLLDENGGISNIMAGSPFSLKILNQNPNIYKIQQITENYINEYQILATQFNLDKFKEIEENSTKDSLSDTFNFLYAHSEANSFSDKLNIIKTPLITSLNILKNNNSQIAFEIKWNCVYSQTLQLNNKSKYKITITSPSNRIFEIKDVFNANSPFIYDSNLNSFSYIFNLYYAYLGFDIEIGTYKVTIQAFEYDSDGSIKKASTTSSRSVNLLQY